jgi:hypothetical protein
MQTLTSQAALHSSAAERVRPPRGRYFRIDEHLNYQITSNRVAKMLAALVPVFISSGTTYE